MSPQDQPQSPDAQGAPAQDPQAAPQQGGAISEQIIQHIQAMLQKLAEIMDKGNADPADKQRLSEVAQEMDAFVQNIGKGEVQDEQESGGPVPFEAGAANVKQAL